MCIIELSINDGYYKILEMYFKFNLYKMVIEKNNNFPICFITLIILLHKILLFQMFQYYQNKDKVLNFINLIKYLY